MSAVPRPTTRYQAHPDYAKAEQLFWNDLPELLPTKKGRWVVYTAQGCIAEGDNEMALFRQCEEAGLARGHFLVAHVESDAPVADIPAEWSTPGEG